MSSSAYGPEQAFCALGNQHDLAGVLAIATGLRNTSLPETIVAARVLFRDRFADLGRGGHDFDVEGGLPAACV